MLRIGQGYDVHRLAEGRKLIIGGVEIGYEKGPIIVTLYGNVVHVRLRRQVCKGKRSRRQSGKSRYVYADTGCG